MAPALTQEPTTDQNGAHTSIPVKLSDSSAFKASPNLTTDLNVYDIHHQKFTSDGLPCDAESWIERARAVSEILAQDAAARDIENKSPKAEISLLKSAGLLKALGPKGFGGGGQSWEVGYKVIREVAKGDGSLGMLLGYHLLWSTTANVVGSDEQKERWQRVIIENNYLVGGSYQLSRKKR
jgi:hypothetical protein